MSKRVLFYLITIFLVFGGIVTIETLLAIFEANTLPHNALNTSNTFYMLQFGNVSEIVSILMLIMIPISGLPISRTIIIFIVLSKDIVTKIFYPKHLL